MSKKTILIFDSNDLFVELLKVIFQETDFQIKSSDSSQDIIKKIRVCNPDIILVDTWISGNNAARISDCLKQESILNNIPIILIGTNFDISEITVKVGAEDFISKPFDIEELEQKMLKYCNFLSVESF